jgi:spore coat polysaccharide biosynthesis predicted glycosyltransferase SpsG
MVLQESIVDAGYECLIYSDDYSVKEVAINSSKISNHWPPEYDSNDFSNVDIFIFDLSIGDYSKFGSFRKASNYKVSINMFEDYGIERFENLTIYPEFKEHKRKVINKLAVQHQGVGFLIVGKGFFKKKDKKHESCVVSMGGADPERITTAVLSVLETNTFENFSRFDVILPKNLSLSLSRQNELKLTGINIYKFGEIDLQDKLGEYSLALISGGITRYECVASSTPFLAVAIHHKQKMITELVAKNGYGENLGVIGEGIDRLLIKHLRNPPLVNKELNGPRLLPNASDIIMNTILEEKKLYEDE